VKGDPNDTRSPGRYLKVVPVMGKNAVMLTMKNYVSLRV